MAGYLHVTPDDVQRVARRYLAPEEAATVVVVPGHEETDER
jgi:predicted Zn-dependent peptidase